MFVVGKLAKRWHLVMWLGGMCMGLRGAGYLSDTFGMAKDSAVPDTSSSSSSSWGDSPHSSMDMDVSNTLYFSNNIASSRHLLSSSNKPNCTPRAVEQFPRDGFTQHQRMHGALALHVTGVIYMFLCLAIVCDVYFVPSLEVLCELLNMQPDVAGATFMAAGSSAPELATSIIGVFIAKDDVGLSTVVGSAIYNVMFVISMCGFATSTALPLTWWPLVRDCVAYTVSIAALIFVIYDEKVMWYESIIFLCLYIVYIIFMFYNKKLEKKVLPICCCCPMSAKGVIPEQTVIHYEKITEHEANGSIKLPGESTPIKHMIDHSNSSSYVGDAGEDRVALIRNGRRLSADSTEYSDESDTEAHPLPGDDKVESVWDIPRGCISRFLWVISIPVNILLYISMPDCRKPRFRRWFWITFILSLVWLSIFSFIMVWMITVIGFSVSVPDSVMSLTFVAFGVSLPDVVASVLVIKDGLGDMAVSNAVGSNVFDILVCLGIPWCIKTCMLNPGSSITVYSEGLVYSSITLLSTVVLLILGIHVSGWKLTKKVSIFFLVVYVAFTILSCLYELNIFGYFHPDECPSDY